MILSIQEDHIIHPSKKIEINPLMNMRNFASASNAKSKRKRNERHLFLFFIFFSTSNLQNYLGGFLSFINNLDNFNYGINFI